MFKALKPAVGSQLSRREIGERMNRAFETADVSTICQAIGEAIRLHNVLEIATMTGMERASVYRAFRGRQSPDFSTVLAVLTAMGFRLMVTELHGTPVAKARRP